MQICLYAWQDTIFLQHKSIYSCGNRSIDTERVLSETCLWAINSDYTSLIWERFTNNGTKNWNIFEDFLSRTIAVLLLSSVSWKCATRTCCLFEINYMNWIKACSPFRLPFFPTGSFSVSLIWPESGFVCKYIWVTWELEVRNEVYYFGLLDFYYKMYVPLSEGKVAKHNCSFFCGVLCRHICNFKYFRVPLIQNVKGNGKHSEIKGSSSKLF